jgi:hypothetical protein
MQSARQRAVIQIWLLLSAVLPLFACQRSPTPVTATPVKPSARVQVEAADDGLQVAFHGGAVLADSLAKVNDWSRVRLLRIQECDSIDRQLWDKIHAATELRKLELIRVPVSDEDLQNFSPCTQLEELLLAHTKVTGAGLRHLGNTNLKRLAIHSRSVTQEGLQQLKVLQKLEALEIHCPELQMSDLASLGELKQLQSLDAGRTPLGPNGLQVLEGLPHLRVLALNARGMDDAQLAIVNSLPELTDLELAGAAITDEGLKQLRCPKLRRLSLDACIQITDAGLYNLSGVPELEELLLMGSSVHGEDLLGLAASGLFKLRRVFVTAEQFRGGNRSIEQLREKLPECEIIILRG